jgi:hypothetical protein
MDKDHLEAFCVHPTVGNQFILVSYIGDSVENTANMKHHVQLLTPLVVTPLPSDMKLAQATDIIWNIGDHPQNGPVTNGKKLSPPKSFYGRVWFMHKRNQILRNCFLDNPTARITPVVPTDFVDHTAVILYFNGPGAVDTEVIEGFIQAYTGKLPTPAVVAHFFNPVTETDQQKWLLGFDTPQAIATFLANKEWTRIACHEKGADIGVGKCGQTKPVANSKSTNKNGGNKRGGKKRGRGRGGKK